MQERKMFLEALEDNMKKVRDHDYLTGKYRGAAHSICNLNYKVPRFIPVFFHNISGYDTHLFIQTFDIDKANLKAIANSEENRVSFSKILRFEILDSETEDPVLDDIGKPIFKTTEIRFLDSFKFLSSFLEKLAKTLKLYQFKELSKHYPEKLYLVKGKLWFSYKYMDSLEIYDEES
ncbi:Ribonuclease H-like domain [Cinara cedri]|uniref:Ribonuclease H-like domain n=1 Tax=Cinara cedri TaxID=506608 RepID=A0A5E4NM89_9HEMI|nr:Ribonuclease H-like domain [Cinara cedri]